jgi:hypothetical protein
MTPLVSSDIRKTAIRGSPFGAFCAGTETTPWIFCACGVSGRPDEPPATSSSSGWLHAVVS